MLKDPKWDVKIESWRQVCLDAADLLERDGWCQHAPMDERGRRCLINAVYSVGDYMACRDAERQIKLFIDKPHLSWWNDTDGRTKEQVIAVLRGCAKCVHAQGVQSILVGGCNIA